MKKSIQTGSYSAALSNGELNQIYVENTAEARVTDTIITKYRTVNGKRQKRRWNKTKNRWEDPAWKDM